VIRSCGQLGYWEAALGLLETMEMLMEEESKGKNLSYDDDDTMATTATEDNGSITATVPTTLGLRITPNVVTLGSALYACAKSSRFEEAIELLDEMKSSEGRFG
jgi:pentatricopeptide repeat protein